MQKVKCMSWLVWEHAVLVNAKHCGASLRKRLLLQLSHTRMPCMGSKLYKNWWTEFRVTKCRGSSI